MSALYGLLNIDRAPVDRDAFDAMGAALRSFAPDRGGAWHGDAVALGHCHLATLGESSPEPMPASFGSITVVAAGRLDNRDDLVEALGLADRRDAIADATIIAEAYRRWNTAAPARLFGDWAFAAWDARTRRLFIARDQFGNTALHYYRDGRRFAFATSRKALFALPHVSRRLNELRLAQHLAHWVTDGAATLHEDILRLPPGHVLTVESDRHTVTRYWRPEQIEPVRLATDQAYTDRFLELYRAAVATRMRGIGPVATSLSAGLDSGSVTSLAAAEAARTGRGLIGFTARPRLPTGRANAGVLLDEWPLAHKAAEWCGLSDHRQVLAAEITPLQAIRRSLEIHDEPEFAAANLDWTHDLLASARSSGARILLTGQLGNGGVSWSGDRFLVLRQLLSGRLLPALREVRAIAAMHDISAARALWHQVVAPARRIAASAVSGHRSLGRGLINPDFLARMQVRRRMLAERYRAAGSALVKPLDQRFEILLPGLNPFGALWHEKGGWYGLDVRDPTADVRLLEFCLAIPDAQFRARGQDRALIRRAFEGQLPPETIGNRRFGRQGSDFAARLAEDRQAMDAAVDQIAASATARDYLDIATLGTRWRRIRDNAPAVPLEDAFALGRALQFGLFLKDFA